MALEKLVDAINDALNKGRDMAEFIEKMEMDSPFKDRLLRPWAEAVGVLVEIAQFEYYSANGTSVKREAVRSLDFHSPGFDPRDET